MTSNNFHILNDVSLMIHLPFSLAIMILTSINYFYIAILVLELCLYFIMLHSGNIYEGSAYWHLQQCSVIGTYGSKTRKQTF